MTVRKAIVVGVVGALIGLALAIRLIAANGGDPTVLTAFGEEAYPTTRYAEERLGAVTTRIAQGHDGKFFFVQANDPFLLDPELNATVLDRPAYRSQRMLYPAIASLLGLLPPAAIVWSMIVVNVVSLGIGTWATARIAQRYGRSAWWGLAFGLNLGLISELAISGSGLLGMALAVLGIWAILNGRFGWATASLTGAVLSREALGLVALGAALWLWLQRRHRQALILIAIPALASGLWGVYVRWRLDFAVGSDVQEIGWPFVGFVEAAADWGTRPISRILGPVVLFLLLRFAWHVARHPTLIGLATVGFVPLALLFTYQVWLGYFDITRAVAPALTGYVLAVFVVRNNRTGTEPSEVVED